MNIGDKVSWTKTSKRGRTISMVRAEGEIVDIDGMIATVKYGRNHRRDKISIDKLRLIGERGELTDFVEAIVSANRQKEQPME